MPGAPAGSQLLMQSSFASNTPSNIGGANVASNTPSNVAGNAGVSKDSKPSDKGADKNDKSADKAHVKPAPVKNVTKSQGSAQASTKSQAITKQAPKTDVRVKPDTAPKTDSSEQMLRAAKQETGLSLD
jgi:hypothetical protein